ncbi:hypothetical protein AVEN_138084-1 [Araneus ventricosus]|uniref:Uncharacterized protein n=1 Tax=Araneus ventricosus TaxID=182803 RepID=A0A4Y2J146_ARAVE|nr:hypothetical protein AVEN_138084-1 [Araneus ventricosus]
MKVVTIYDSGWRRNSHHRPRHYFSPQEVLSVIGVEVTQPYNITILTRQARTCLLMRRLPIRVLVVSNPGWENAHLYREIQKFLVNFKGRSGKQNKSSLIRA